MAEVAKLLQTDMRLRDLDRTAGPGEGSAALMQPGEISEHLGRLGRVLDTDPHFRYGVGIDPARPDLRPEPHLIAATQEAIPGDLWLTFKIYERSAQSLDERPVPIKMKFEFEETGPEHQAYRDWLKYGKPFEASASFTADLPGGLHTGGMSGRVRISPAEGEETRFRNRQRVVAPDGTVLAELGFTVSSTTGMDRTGSWAEGIDDTGILTSESTLDATSQTGGIKFELAPLAGLHATKARPVVTFASHVVAPNRLQVAGEYGPFHDYSPLPEGADPLVPPALVRVVKALATVQTRTSKPVLIPDISDFTQDEVQDLRRAAALIEGQTIIRTWTHFTFGRNPEAVIEPGMHFEVMAGGDLMLPRITGDELLGLVQQRIASVTVDSVDGVQVNCVPFREDTMYVTLVDALPDAPPGKKVLAARPLD